MDMIASGIDLGNLRLSLTGEQQAQLDSALRMIQELAMQDAAQKAMRAMCPLCELAAHTDKIGSASQQGDGVNFWHKSEIGRTLYRKCLADPIRQLPWVKL